MKKAYYYLFYKLYKFSEAAPSRWMSDWKAELVIDILEICLIFSGITYYTVLTGKMIDLGSSNLMMLMYLAVIAFPNYLIFHHKDQWKNYVHEFEKLPRKKDIIGSIIVWIVIFLVIANFIFSFYLYYQM